MAGIGHCGVLCSVRDQRERALLVAGPRPAVWRRRVMT